ncbi:hypothetical protein [Luteibacter yeojuensis]|uniref:Uncharacterized protein n=1 Tax=Luteibacter yeojuensis TaxID=345309 RepID=A0A7X5QUN8_9GAMM|nr:hypothetical protein [Luteibacter yeojuensis]NID15746.1 hypothetical protein [Luteibacter yeojuensis]
MNAFATKPAPFPVSRQNTGDRRMGSVNIINKGIFRSRKKTNATRADARRHISIAGREAPKEVDPGMNEVRLRGKKNFPPHPLRAKKMPVEDDRHRLKLAEGDQ